MENWIYTFRMVNIKKCISFLCTWWRWTHGKKEAEYEKIKVFIENGFAVANVEYRLAKQAAAPAAVEDVHCALVYLLKNAHENMNAKMIYF